MLVKGSGAGDQEQPGSSPPLGGGDASTVVAQAFLTMAANGMRCWGRFVQAYGRHQSGILRAVLASQRGGGLTELEAQAIAEDIRAYLREVADVSLQEARLLHLELERLGERLASATAGAGVASAPVRRWRVKP